jgi:hypothetical protein
VTAVPNACCPSVLLCSLPNNKKQVHRAAQLQLTAQLTLMYFTCSTQKGVGTPIKSQRKAHRGSTARSSVLLLLLLTGSTCQRRPLGTHHYSTSHHVVITTTQRRRLTVGRTGQYSGVELTDQRRDHRDVPTDAQHAQHCHDLFHQPPLRLWQRAEDAASLQISILR